MLAFHIPRLPFSDTVVPMPLLPPSDLVFTLPQLEEVVGQFCLDFKGNGDADAERCREVMAIFLGYFTTKSRPLNETSEAGEMLTTIVPVHNTASMRPSSQTVNSHSRLRAR